MSRFPDARRIFLFLLVATPFGIAGEAPHSPSEQDSQKIECLIKQLGSSDFSEREYAENALMQCGPIAIALLKKALEDKDLEIQFRAESALRGIQRELLQKQTGDKALSEKVDEALKETPDAFILVTRLVKWQGGEFIPVPDDDVSLNWLYEKGASPSNPMLDLNEKTDANGWVVFRIQPASAGRIFGYGCTVRRGNEEPRATRWNKPNDVLKAEAGTCLLLPPIELVPPMKLSPKEGAPLRLSKDESLSWEPVPEAKRYVIQIDLVKKGEDGTGSVCNGLGGTRSRCLGHAQIRGGSKRQIALSEIQKQLLPEYRKNLAPGETYEWSIRALDQEDQELTSSASRFILRE